MFYTPTIFGNEILLLECGVISLQQAQYYDQVLKRADFDFLIYYTTAAEPAVDSAEAPEVPDLTVADLYGSDAEPLDQSGHTEDFLSLYRDLQATWTSSQSLVISECPVLSTPQPRRRSLSPPTKAEFLAKLKKQDSNS
ncbi:hypothetical protein GEMRC1_000588 [Eukaryota sp. GEM-RC1]